MATGRLSLAEQIARLEEAAPTDYDPEEIQSHVADVDNEMQVDTSAAREHYLDVGPSNLRKMHQSVADPKYEGVRTSRKKLMENDEEDDSGGEIQDDEESYHEEDGEDGEDEEDEGDEEHEHEEENEERHVRFEDVPSKKQPWKTNGAISDEDIPSESGDGSEESEREKEPTTPSNFSSENLGPSEDTSSTLKKKREEDLEKGQAVKRQVALWDSLLDTRIRLQKSVVSANQLPPPSQMKTFMEMPECSESLSKLLHEASLLTDELFDLQENLLSANDVLTPPSRKRRKLDSDAPIDEYAENLVAMTADAAALEQAFHPYLVQTLSKWSSKIQAVAPSVLLPSNRGTFLKGGQQLKSAAQLIDETLADHEKLLARTQISRGKKGRIGAPQENVDAPDAVDPDIFDDTDFYQKMLRDIIDARGNSNGGEDWMISQKQKKAKKKVDTKASKGRKLRYEVHEKLQNFMVPVPVPGAWHEEQIDELFTSLLGKGFENVGINVDTPQVDQTIDLGGFRVFG
ncbi:TRAUB-domain-containing protein [Phlegmacium glaucopus]|nr:TRAUB-domain-containing protein [Phlegmacium glaucopus]